MLHAPAKQSDYRHHLHEGATRCHRTGWIALGREQITCARCSRRLEADGLPAAGGRGWAAIAWRTLATRLGARRAQRQGAGRL